MADLYGAYKDYKQAKPEADVPQLEEHIELTMFADYRVPQILRHRGILEYSEQLAAAIDSETELEHRGAFEVELRAATIVVVGQIFRKAQELGSYNLQQALQCEFEVDWVLWQLALTTHKI